jgi:site-specific DNA-methyltransferase (adenine-specific)
MATITLKQGDVIQQLKTIPDESIDAVIQDPPYNLNFMNKKWDSKGAPQDFQKWCQSWAEECLRVLRPGGYLLSFGGTRTYHRMTAGIEDAGFEVKDCLTYLYGTGFPKSLSIGKAWDKKMGNERTFVGLNPNHRPNSPKDNTKGDYNPNSEGNKTITKGTSVWEGYGTALKPAAEPIVLAQKPKIGTYVENLVEYSIGAMNINSTRIPTNPDVDDMLRIVERKGRDKASDWAVNSGFKNETNNLTGVPADGRFPANVVHDGSTVIVNQFPNSSGAGGSIPKVKVGGFGRNIGDGTYEYDDSERKPFDSGEGSVARFFYCAKPSKSEKTVLKTINNTHPTVKPIKLLDWLIKLVCPPAEHMGRQPVILDCFVGSGTTAIAAHRNNVDCIGIDINEEYLDIAKQRLLNDDRLNGGLENPIINY